MAFTNSAEGGSSGTTVTTGNTGGSSGTAASTVAIDTTGGGDIEFNTAAAKYGALGYRYVMPASGVAAHRMLFPHGSAVAGRYAIGAAFRLSSVPTAQEDLMHIRHSGGNCGHLGIRSDGKLQLYNASGATTALTGTVASAALQANHWYFACLTRTKGTGASDGQLGYAYYDLEAGGTLVESFNVTNCDAGTADTTHGAFGRSTGRTQGRNVDFDDIRGDALGSGYMTPVVSDLDVDSYTNHVTFVANNGTAPFGISQDSGAATTPTVIDDGTTSGVGVFIIPRHTTDTLEYTITDDLGDFVDTLQVTPQAASTSWPKIPGDTPPTTTWV